MLNQYELMVIFTPILSDDDLNKSVEGYEGIVKKSKGKIVHKETWGLRQLAYPIDKKTTGIYQLFEFQAPGELINELEIQFKRDEQIMRFMITRLDKDAVKYNEGRRKRLKGLKEKAGAEEQTVKEEV